MGRRPQPEIRERVLAACVDHALEHGLPDRLAPFATAAGVSQRMLVYHFGTRDELLLAVLRQARERQLAAWSELFAPRDDEPYAATLRRAWRTMSGPEGRPFLRIFAPLNAADGEPLWPGFRREATTDWLGPLEAGLATIGRPDLATLVLAVLRGLLADLDATGDAARCDAAFGSFAATLA